MLFGLRTHAEVWGYHWFAKGLANIPVLLTYEATFVRGELAILNIGFLKEILSRLGIIDVQTWTVLVHILSDPRFSPTFLSLFYLRFSQTKWFTTRFALPHPAPVVYIYSVDLDGVMPLDNCSLFTSLFDLLEVRDHSCNTASCFETCNSFIRTIVYGVS